MPNTYQSMHSTQEMSDPDPLYFAFELFTAIVSGAGLVVTVVEAARQRRIRSTEVRASVIERLNAIDRALNRLDECYRSLVSIYDELDLLNIPFGPGKGTLRVARGMKTELDRLRSTAFSAGNELQNSLSDLAGSLSASDVDRALELTNALDGLFRDALTSKRLLDFFIQLGMLMQFVSAFIYEIAERYDFRLTSNRTPLLGETLQRLQNRLKELG
jgi:hypothetical protein